MTRQRTVFHPVRQFKVTQIKRTSDGDDQFKNDPDVKKWMNEINKDFESKSKTVTEDQMEQETPSSNAKNVSQLLSALYGEAETKSGNKENFSSVGKYLHYFVYVICNVHGMIIRRLCGVC